MIDHVDMGLVHHLSFLLPLFPLFAYFIKGKDLDLLLKLAGKMRRLYPRLLYALLMQFDHLAATTI